MKRAVDIPDDILRRAAWIRKLVREKPYLWMMSREERLLVIDEYFEVTAYLMFGILERFYKGEMTREEAEALFKEQRENLLNFSELD